MKNHPELIPEENDVIGMHPREAYSIMINLMHCYNAAYDSFPFEENPALKSSYACSQYAEYSRYLAEIAVSICFICEHLKALFEDEREAIDRGVFYEDGDNLSHHGLKYYCLTLIGDKKAAGEYYVNTITDFDDYLGFYGFHSDQMSEIARRHEVLIDPLLQQEAGLQIH
ncbi:MAG: hypothetical protein ACD_65C00005G0003 [uncultured bacterium]|nr:MAG: hypothetical protein ACD_65C00005G0003 [uncultured bacterium]